MALYDELRAIADILQDIGKIEEQKRLLHIQKELLDIQKKLLDLDGENRDLKEKLKIKNDVFFENNAYWLKKADASIEGPFCSACWDKNKHFIHLQRVRTGVDIWICPVCKTDVRISQSSGQV
jgi:predicted  nucleic acid-binding Zn-ribbon protein